MSDTTDQDLPPLGEPTPHGRSAAVTGGSRRRTAVVAAVALLLGLGAGFALARGLDEDPASNVVKPSPANRSEAFPPPTEDTLPPECVATMRSVQQALAVLDQGLRDLRSLNLGETERAVREAQQLRGPLDEQVRRCLEEMGD